MSAFAVTSKACSKCGVIQLAAEFKPDKENRSGLSSWCRGCCRAATSEWFARNPDRRTAYAKKSYRRRRVAILAERKRTYDPVQQAHKARWIRFKMTREEYEALHGFQQGACAICRRPETSFPRLLSVDHDHRCCPKPPTCGNCTRGLLCGPCNLTLHSLEHREGWLAAAQRYLQLPPPSQELAA